MFKRGGFVFVVTMLLVLAAPLTAWSAKPATGCPASSQFDLVDAEGWWARTIVGFAEEGLTLEEAAELFGLGTVAELETFIKETVLADVDKNGNGFLCIAELPNTPGNPAYFFNGIDDKSSKP